MASKLTRCPCCGRKQQRTPEQNRAYWPLLHEIADRLRPQGQAYSAETWAEYFKERFLGAEEVKLPNGKVKRITRSTADLDVDEFSDYLTQVQVWASEHGVTSDS